MQRTTPASPWARLKKRRRYTHGIEKASGLPTVLNTCNKKQGGADLQISSSITLTLFLISFILESTCLTDLPLGQAGFCCNKRDDTSFWKLRRWWGIDVQVWESLSLQVPLAILMYCIQVQLCSLQFWTRSCLCSRIFWLKSCVTYFLASNDAVE